MEESSTKEFYRNYVADVVTSPLNEELYKQIRSFEPRNVLEFGCGTGKNLKSLKKDMDVFGVDISFQNMAYCFTNNLRVSLGDELWLQHLAGFDVVFTCSVLDHIDNIDDIVKEFKRIANRAVIIAETNSYDDRHYYKHDFESFGFVNTGFHWKSDYDGATYWIWIWKK